MSEPFARVDVAAIDAATWQRLTLGRPLLSLELLQECAAAREGRLVVLLSGDPHDPAAAVVGTVRDAGRRDVPLERLLFGRLQRVAVALSLLGPMLTVGSPLGQDSGLVLRAGASTDAMRAALESLERWAGREGLGLGFLAIPEGSDVASALPPQWARSGGRSRTSTEMRVRWADFDGYLATLAERGKVDKMVVRERRRNVEAGVVIDVRTPDPALAEELQRLADLHYRLRNTDAEPTPPGMLARALPRMGERALVFEAVREGRRCAMMALIRSGDVGWPAWIGIEPEDRPNDFTYFNMAYYEVAARAAGWGLRRILYGNSVTEAKVRRGAVRVPMHFVVRPRGAVRRALVRVALGLHARFVAPKFA